MSSARAWLARWSHYTSTVCIHGDCYACRLRCKVCGGWCRCGCHRGVPQQRRRERDTA